MIGLDKSTMRSSQRIVVMPLNMLIFVVIVVVVVAVNLRADLLGREGLDGHLTEEHFVSVIEVTMRLFRHSGEASIELNDAFADF